MTMTMTSSLRFLLAATLVSSAAAAAVSYPAELQNGNRQDLQLKTQRYADQQPAADDGLSVAYLPAYAIPDGSPVDPCVTCRPRRTTHNCRRNPADDGCPTRSSPACTTKRCSSLPTTKRLCGSASSSSSPRADAAAASLSSTAAAASTGDTKKRGPSPSVNSVTPDRSAPKRFVSNTVS